jgi:hypothetical protein
MTSAPVTWVCSRGAGDCAGRVTTRRRAPLHRRPPLPSRKCEVVTSRAPARSRGTVIGPEASACKRLVNQLRARAASFGAGVEKPCQPGRHLTVATLGDVEGVVVRLRAAIHRGRPCGPLTICIGSSLKSIFVSPGEVISDAYRLAIRISMLFVSFYAPLPA